MDREILYLKVPSFPLALERLRDPSLKGRPVAICGSGSGPGLLQAVSPEARLEGLSKGMSRREAAGRCPGLKILTPDPALYGRAAEALFHLLAAYSPLVEPARPGSVFLDLTGTTRLFGPARDLAWRIRREIRVRLGLEPYLGMAANKLLSRIAVKVLHESGLCDVFPGGERHFLEPLEVEVLPAARPLPHAERLRELNIRQVAHLLPIPLSTLQLAFGRASLALYRQARGLDASPVRPPSQSPEVTEEETMPEESNEEALLLAVLQWLAEEAGQRLRDMKALVGRMELEVQYADTALARRSARLYPPTDLDCTLFQSACRLLERTVLRRVRIRRVAIHCLQLERPSAQAELFPYEAKGERRKAKGEKDALVSVLQAGRQKALQQALDEIRSRFGKEAVSRGKAKGESISDSSFPRTRETRGGWVASGFLRLPRTLIRGPQE